MAKVNKAKQIENEEDDNLDTAAEAGAKAKGKAKAEPKPEAKADARVVKAVKAQADAESKVGSALKAIVKLVIDHEIPRDVVIVSIMEARGVERVYAAQQASRIFTICKNEDNAQKFIDGEITVTDAIKAGSKKQENPNKAKAKENAEASLKTAVTKAVAAAKAADYDLGDFIALCKAEAKRGGLSND